VVTPTHAKRCSFSHHQLTAGVAAGVDAAQDSAQPRQRRLMTANDWCPHSAVGRVHSLRSCRMCLEVPAWVAWLTAAMRTMLELWRQLMTAPLLPAIPLPWSAVGQWTGGRKITWITTGIGLHADITAKRGASYEGHNWDRIACWHYSKTWCVIWRSPPELQGCPLPTDRRNTLPTQWCHMQGILWLPRSHCACVRLHSVAATATS